MDMLPFLNLSPESLASYKSKNINMSMEIANWWPFRFAKFSDHFSSIRILSFLMFYRASEFVPFSSISPAASGPYFRSFVLSYIYSK